MVVQLFPLSFPVFEALNLLESVHIYLGGFVREVLQQRDTHRVPPWQDPADHLIFA